MILMFGDKKFNIREEYLKSNISKSTGKELNTYKFEMRVIGDKKLKEFKSLMEKYGEKFIKQVDENGNDVAVFNVKDWNYVYTNDFNSEDVSFLCEVKIEQKEILNTKSLVIAGIKVQVLRYIEEYEEMYKSIIIKAVIKINETQREKINETTEKTKYFDVVRPDINEDVLKMRFGKVIWSKHESYNKMNIILVEKQYDEESITKHSFFWPELYNMMNQISKNKIYIEELEKILKSKNIVDDEELKKIKDKSNKAIKEENRQYYLVDEAEEEFKNDENIE